MPRSSSPLFFQTGQDLASSYLGQVGLCSQPALQLTCHALADFHGSPNLHLESRPSQGCQWHLSGGTLGLEWTNSSWSYVHLGLFLCFFCCTWFTAAPGSCGCLSVKLCKPSSTNTELHMDLWIAHYLLKLEFYMWRASKKYLPMAPSPKGTDLFFRKE